MTAFLVIFVMIGFQISASNPITKVIPKEKYLTYYEYVKQQSLKPSIIGNDDWIQIQYSDPLISKFQVNASTTVSVSKFSGNIGSPLANLNRWRNQIGLPKVTSPASHIKKRVFPFGEGSIITLANKSNYVLIIWITIKTTHFFTKVESSSPIKLMDYESFINKQTWDTL